MRKNLIRRPERWAIPFSDKMGDSEVNELMAAAPFKDLDLKNFSGRVNPRGILRNDARLTSYERGEIVVRQGDWGNSAFFVLSGSLRADLESTGDSSTALRGQQKPKRKNLFQLMAQVFNGQLGPEVRDVRTYENNQGISGQQSGKQTRIFLPDFATVLKEERTATIEAGQFFGELSALGRTPRQATVVADQATRLLEIRWQGLRDLMRGDPGIRAHIDTVFRERALKWFLLNTPIFSHLNEAQLERLVEAAEFETYGKYDWAASFKRLARKNDPRKQDSTLEPLIAKEGDHPNGVLIVRSGLARVTKKFENGHRTVGYLGPGHVFGMEEIEASWQKRNPGQLKHSMRAIGIATVVVIPTRVVEELLLDKKPLKRRPDPRSTEPFEKINEDFIEFLVEKRYVNGTATMLIDMDRCTRCDDCVKACASTHDNNPRFSRTGPIQNNVMVTGACMHCEDPVCMIECPTGAIHRDISQGTVVINDQTCIGCSACSNNCPFGAIRMVEIRHPDGSYIRDSESQLPIVKATKCDLCFDQLGGPACQRACPHGAMVRMDMGDTHQLAQWLKTD